MTFLQDVVSLFSPGFTKVGSCIVSLIPLGFTAALERKKINF